MPKFPMAVEGEICGVVSPSRCYSCRYAGGGGLVLLWKSEVKRKKSIDKDGRIV